MANGNGQILKPADRVNSVRALFEKAKGQIALALPKHMSPDRMLRIAMTSIQRTPELLECTPVSLVSCVIQAAQLGLEPDGVLGEAYLIPFRDRKAGTVVCTFIPGYKGLIKLARQSGQVSTVYARVVHEKDRFEFAYGLNDKLEHVPFMPSLDAELEQENIDPAGRITYVYAIAKLKDGGVQFEVMARHEIEAVRARSRAGQSGPWVTDFPEMAKKTVLRRLSKMLPASVELARAVALDERADAGLEQQFESVIDIGDASVGEAPDAKPRSIADLKAAAKAKATVDEDGNPLDATA